MKLFLAGLLLLGSGSAWAWGGRGHNAICEVAVHLIEDKALKEFMQARPHMLGHVCNIPDIYWKSLDGEARKLGDPTHYFDPEILGLKTKDIPLDYAKIIADYTGKPNAFKAGATIFSVANELGSNWWRADQFMRRLKERKSAFAQVKPPENSKQQFDDQNEFNNLVYQTIVDMGLLGHFVGDNSQPFHVTSDHDGWFSGHGGIHSYYEDAVVAQFDGDLNAEILKKARTIKNSKSAKSFLSPATTVEKMKALGVISQSEIALVFKKDPILEKSEQKEEKGMFNRIKPAKRKSAAEGLKAFRPLILTQMSRSALLLAHLWDEAFAELNKPKLSAYKSYRYPLSPEFVPPDYLGAVETKATQTEIK